MDHFWTNGYLVAVSVILAFELAQFNTVGEWIPWCLLGALALYDLCAVLTPCGPLRMLLNAVNENQGGEQALSGLLFEADVGQHQSAEAMAEAQRTQATTQRAQATARPYAAEPKSGSMSAGESKGDGDLEQGSAARAVSGASSGRGGDDNGGGGSKVADPARRRPPPPRPRPQQHVADEEDDGVRGVKLGLGDFIFYSVLVSTAARHDFVTFASCTLVVLLGLGLTLLLLIVAGKALPALPISIFLGVFFYFLGRYTLEPYVDNMTFHGVVI
jgi:presenilin 1